MNFKQNLLFAGFACLGLGYCTAVSAQETARSNPPFEIPEWESSDGAVSLRLRMRAIHDFYNVSADFNDPSRNFNLKNDNLRSLRIGIDGQLTDKIRVRADANLINSQVNWSDVYLGYVDDKIEVFVGQHYQSAPLEFMSRTVNSLLPERALVNLAFGQNQRNLGAVARIKGNNWQVIGGVYHGNINAGDVFGNDVLRSAQMRATYAVRNEERDVLHLGVSLRVRDAQDGPLLRYSLRPAASNFAQRRIDTGAIAKNDTTFALEAAMIKGPVYVTTEHDFLWADTATGQMKLQGTYVEAGWWLTGEGRRYNAGTGGLVPVSPRRSIQDGGVGAVALVARYDHVDLTDQNLGSRAGRVDAFSVGVSWMPVDYITFRLAASNNRYTGPNVSMNGDAQVVMGRAQLSF